MTGRGKTEKNIGMDKYGLTDALEIDFGVAILSDLCGLALTNKSQPVRLFDDSSTTSEVFYREDANGKPYVHDFKNGRRWYPITAFAKANRLTFASALKTLTAQYADNGGSVSAGLRPRSIHRATDVGQPLEPDSICPRAMDYARATFDRNGLAVYLRTLFGLETACWLIDRYWLGTSKHYRFSGHLSTVLPQIDHKGRIRQLKVMGFNPQTGRRLKKRDHAEEWNAYANKYESCLGKDKIYFLGKDIKPGGNFRQCFFGEHLVTLEPDKYVAIVEAESTALVCSVLFPEYVWLATGGANGCRWYDPTVFMVLAGRYVILFPDNGIINPTTVLYAYDDWCQKADALRKLKIARSITVNDLLFQNSTGPADKRDLRDFLINTDQTGFAVDEGVPVFWNLPGEYYIKGKQLAQSGMMSPRPVNPYEAGPIPELSKSPFGQKHYVEETILPTSVAPKTMDEGVNKLTPDYEGMTKAERDCIQMAEKNPALIDLVRALDLLPVNR